LCVFLKLRLHFAAQWHSGQTAKLQDPMLLRKYGSVPISTVAGLCQLIFFLGASSPLRWFNNKEFLCITQYSRTQLHFTQQYSRYTATCFGPICGPSSGCDLTFEAAIQDVWGVLLG